MSKCPTCGRAFDHDETTFAGFLRARREERGWSLREVAAKTDNAISCPYLSQIEMGRIQDVSARKLAALASVYSVSILGLVRLASGKPYVDFRADAEDDELICRADSLTPSGSTP